MAKLRTTVHVDGKVYGPGDVSDEIAARISNPNVWDGDAPAGAGSAVPVHPTSPILAARDATAQASRVEASGDGPPPKGGAGSGKDAWATYAASKGVEVDEDATRDEIVAALDEAGVPTE